LSYLFDIACVNSCLRPVFQEPNPNTVIAPSGKKINLGHEDMTTRFFSLDNESDGEDGAGTNHSYQLVITGLCAPPRCCKRKVKMTVWSAQMYPVFDGAEAPDLGGMRCAVVLTSLAASKGFSVLQVSTGPGSTILPSRCSPADLA
jgi:hypothetical protein